MDEIITNEEIETIISYPYNTTGYYMEKNFIDQVEKYKLMGYGRMKQIIQKIWDIKLEKNIAEFHKTNKKGKNE